MSPPARPDPAASPSGGARVAGGLLAGALALGGCAAPGAPPDPADARRAAGSSRFEVRAGATELLRAVAARARLAVVADAVGEWQPCDDIGGAVAYMVSARMVSARIEPAAGRVLESVRSTLDELGVALARVQEAGRDVVVYRGRRGDLSVRVIAAPTDPVVLFDVVGPCVQVGALDDELWLEDPEPLGLAGPG